MHYCLYIVILLLFFMIIYKKMCSEDKDEQFTTYLPYRGRWFSSFYTPFLWNNPTRYYGYYPWNYPWYGGISSYYADSYRYGLW